MTRKKKRQVGDPRRNYAAEWRRWRRKRGWTQAEMASVLGVTRRTIIFIEGGHHRPQARSRIKMEALQKRYAEAQA